MVSLIMTLLRKEFRNSFHGLDGETQGTDQRDVVASEALSRMQRMASKGKAPLVYL